MRAENTSKSNVCKLTLLGSPSIQSIADNQEIEFPTRKAKALFIYLACSEDESTTRAKLANLLWERSAEEQSRASLRQTLATIRKVFADKENSSLLQSTSELIQLDRNAVDLDVSQFRKNILKDIPESLEKAIALYKGPFLEGFSINGENFEQWIRETRTQLQELAIQAITQLAQFHSTQGEIDQAILMHQKLLTIDMFHELSHRKLMQLFTITGRRKAAIEQYQQYKEMLFSELKVEPESETIDLYHQILNKTPLTASADQSHVQSSNPINTAHFQDDEFNPEIRFCHTKDNVRLAYSIIGNGPTLVKTGNWMTHLEYDWRTPVWRHLHRALGHEFKYVRYDARANGLSDWEIQDMNLDAFSSDLETVLDAVGDEIFALFGVSQGCAVAIDYAVRHPEKVSHLILHGGFAYGWRHGSTERIEKAEAYKTLAKYGWGQDDPKFRQMFTELFIPDGSSEQMQWFNDLQQISSSPENAARFMEAVGQMDVRSILKKVSVPTLVFHCREDNMISYRYGRELAASIPNARFVTLESRNHLVLEHEPAWKMLLAETVKFVK